jgi:signal peptidase I
MLMQLVSVLALLAAPVALVCIIDDWFLRPRRQIVAAPQLARDPRFMAVLYYALPVLVAAGVIQLLAAERLDFSLVLLLIAVITGVFWLFDVVLLRPHRIAAATAAGKDPGVVSEPGTVDYARSFFPVAVVVLLLRSFVFEPFRIPSDSMMPTLLDGDFIIVNKYAYGLRLPVLNRKFVDIGQPQRGDVVVFRYPLDPSINYIKRLVGLPGDRVQVRDNRITINGVPAVTTDRGLYDDGCYEGMHLEQEQLGSHSHLMMFCPPPDTIDRHPLESCNRNQKFDTHSFVCAASPGGDGLGSELSNWGEQVIPAGYYLMMGDNRDNSEDGRKWGFVPENYLVGRATRIWFNWDRQRSNGPISRFIGTADWGRIGTAIQ